MVKYKKLKLSLITLLLALVVALTAAVFVVNGRGAAVYADDRYIELDGNSVFYTTIRGAEICESEPVQEGESESRYTMFKIGPDETVSYRQNLAYQWYSGKDEEGNYTNNPVSKSFSMEFYFPEIAFKRFYIKFQSQQHVLTEDGRSDNYLVFTAVDNGAKVQISVSQTIEETEGEIEGMVDIGVPVAINEHIKIELGNYAGGDYVIKLNGEDTQGRFKNVYGKFATYVASGDNAVTPLTFGAVFDGVEGTVGEAQIVLYDINGQSFKMHKQGDVYKIRDTAAPVICFSKTPSYLEYGKSIGFQYKVIDVVASSPRATAYYYVLSGDQFASDTFDYDKTDYTQKADGDDAAEEEKSPFIKVTSSSGIRINTDANTFIPTKYLKSEVKGLVKIYYEISDVSSTSTSQTDRVFVDWYVRNEAPEALENVYEYKNVDKTSNFLRLIDTNDVGGGATYAKPGDSEKADPLAAYKESVREFKDAYQDKINEAIAGLEDGKLYAGGNKFYLPAIDFDFVDEYSLGTDYKYSIYYKGSTTGSHTSLDSNKLAIDLNDADVTYRFTIFVTDVFGNPMRYPTLDESTGEVVWEEITTTDVWDEDFAELLPYFEFDVSYRQATAEDPENLSLSYVGGSYSGVSFKITGVSQTYTTKYNLYVFDRNAYHKEVGETLDYETFTNNTQALLNNTFKEGVNTRKYFTTVKPASELLESDENYEEFKKLNWNATSITFTPQSVENFYVVELNLTDKRSQETTYNYATVAASVQTTALKGESDWLKNNKTSIVLFVVAGVCLLALVALLVIKPKDKGDIDAIYTEVENKSRTKKQTKKSK